MFRRLPLPCSVESASSTQQGGFPVFSASKMQVQRDKKGDSGNPPCHVKNRSSTRQGRVTPPCLAENRNSARRRGCPSLPCRKKVFDVTRRGEKPTLSCHCAYKGCNISTTNEKWKKGRCTLKLVHPTHPALCPLYFRPVLATSCHHFDAFPACWPCLVGLVGREAVWGWWQTPSGEVSWLVVTQR